MERPSSGGPLFASGYMTAELIFELLYRNVCYEGEFLHRFQTKSWIVMVLILLQCGRFAGAAGEAVTPTAGVKIAGKTTLKPGIYHLEDPGAGVVQVSGRGFTLDCKGAKLVVSGAG